MTLVYLALFSLLTGCSPSSWVGIADDMFDNAITVSVQQGAIDERSNVKVSVEITQK